MQIEASAGESGIRSHLEHVLEIVSINTAAGLKLKAAFHHACFNACISPVTGTPGKLLSTKMNGAHYLIFLTCDNRGKNATAMAKKLISKLF